MFDVSVLVVKLVACANCLERALESRVVKKLGVDCVARFAVNL